jgi:hypothetical protein
MSTDLQDLLREGLDRLTAGASVPDGLVGRAQRRNRQRRVRMRAAIAAGTAVAAAAAVITVSLAATGNKPGSAPVRTQTVADVITRTERALAASADHGNAIQVVQGSGRNVTFGLNALSQSGSFENPGPSPVLPRVLSKVTAQRLVSWTYHGVYLQEGFSAAGRLVFVNANGVATTRSGRAVAENYGVTYPVRVRWHTILHGVSGTPPPTPRCDAGPSGYPSWRTAIATLLSCGLYHLSGRQQVDGVAAITLVSGPQLGAGVRSTIWIDPATYLPLRTSVTVLAGAGRGRQLTNDFRFLPPTRANLAALHAAIRRVAIPVTFRELPPTVVMLAGANGL